MVFLLWRSGYDFREGMQESRIREEVGALLAGSENLLLFFRMEPLADLLGNQRGVAAGAVVYDEIHMDLILYGLVYDFWCVLHHLRIQHAGDQFLKREGLGKGFLVAHPSLPSPWQTASGAAANGSTSSLGNNVPHFTQIYMEARNLYSEIKAEAESKANAH